MSSVKWILSCDVLQLYSRGAWFESRLGHLTILTGLFHGFAMLGHYLD
jgi:hypothetical protein